MDWVRSFHKGKMSIEDPDEGSLIIPVTWYRAPKGAKTYRGINAFTSGNWYRDAEDVTYQLGDQRPYSVPYYNGKNVWGYTGQCVIGTARQFELGMSAADLAAPAKPVPQCCGGAAYVIGGWLLGGVVPASSATSPAGRGGWLLGGVVPAKASTSPAGSGGWLLGGVVPAEASTSPGGSGGWLLGGVVPASSSTSATSSSGWLVGGVVPASSSTSARSSGGWLLGGVVPASSATSARSSGGWLLGGASPASSATSARSSGGWLLGGASPASSATSARSSGGWLLGGVVPPLNKGVLGGWLVGGVVPSSWTGGSTTDYHFTLIGMSNAACTDCANMNRTFHFVIVAGGGDSEHFLLCGFDDYWALSIAGDPCTLELANQGVTYTCPAASFNPAGASLFTLATPIAGCGDFPLIITLLPG